MLTSCVPNLLLGPVAVGPFKKQKITAYNLISGVDCRRDSWVSAGIHFCKGVFVDCGQFFADKFFPFFSTNSGTLMALPSSLIVPSCYKIFRPEAYEG